MLVEQLLQPLAVRLVAIERARNVDRHQFFARLIAGHAEKRLVEIEKTSLRRGNKHALLYARNEGPVFLLRALPVGDVLQNVYRSKLVSGGIGEHRVRRQEVALQPGIGIVTFAGKSLAVRANLVRGILTGQKFCHAPPNQPTAFTPQQMAEPLIASQDASLPIVN